jgi:hypothetical protein
VAAGGIDVVPWGLFGFHCAVEIKTKIKIRFLNLIIQSSNIRICTFL